MDIQFYIPIAISILGLLVSIFFGDKAGTNAAIRHEKQTEAEKRVAALKSLLNQIDLIKSIVKSNTEYGEYVLHYSTFVKLPTIALETAFVSDKPIISQEEKLLNIVNEYLSKAYQVNAAIDFLARVEVTAIAENSREPQNIFVKIMNNCKDISTTLIQMENCLRTEIG